MVMNGIIAGDLHDLWKRESRLTVEMDRKVEMNGSRIDKKVEINGRENNW